MIKDEMTLRVTQPELARDIHAVLARVRDEGLEVIVEQDSRPIAVIRRPEGPGRKLSECIAIAKVCRFRTPILRRTFKQPLA